MGAPIGHTCPDIDRAIKHIDQAASEVEDTIEDRATIRSITSELDSAKDIMEELRTANDKLRSWGEESEEKLEEMERDRDYHQEESEKKDQTIKELQEQIDQLQNQEA